MTAPLWLACRMTFLVIACSLLNGCVSMVGKAVSSPNPDALVSDAQRALQDFRRDQNQTWAQHSLMHAKAVLVAPRLLRAGLTVGGSGGRAVLIARQGNAWAGPAFYDIASVSVGLQAGVEMDELIVAVMTDKGLASLMSNSVKLGADVSIAAGPIGAGAESTVNADMVAFSRNKGVYGGVNIEGSVIHPNTAWNSEYYERPNVQPRDILIAKSVTSRKSAPLLVALSRAWK